MLRWAVAAGLGALVLAGCASPPDPSRIAPASPPVLGAWRGEPAVTDAGGWIERRAPMVRQALQDQVYGRFPDLPAAVVEARERLMLDDVGEAIIEQWVVRLGEGAAAPRFHILLAAPPGGGPAPLVLVELFCGLRAAAPGRPDAVFEDPDVTPGVCRADIADPLAQLIFGRRINGPPIASLTSRGYALAMIYPAEVVPDDPDTAPAALAALQPGVPAASRGGALAVWAALFSRTLDVLEDDPRIDPARVAVWGHSRHGKAALLAAAFDPRLDAVIAHQSGRGGASLTRSGRGETVAQITGSYGYWFSPAFRGAAGADIDQHMLLALIAPRPVLIGAGLGDGWSDPAGAFAAAQGADPVYRLLGSRGLTARGLGDFDPQAGLVIWSRPGGHGVTTGDWQAFERFLGVVFGGG